MDCSNAFINCSFVLDPIQFRLRVHILSMTYFETLRWATMMASTEAD